MISSAKHVILCSLLKTGMPHIEAKVLIFHANSSIIKVHIMGERGHPWCVPLEIWKLLQREPSANTCAEGKYTGLGCLIRYCLADQI